MAYQILISIAKRAEAIRGELFKIGIKLSKRTVQKHMRGVSRPNSPDQTGGNWSAFIQNHLPYLFAVDFATINNFFNFRKPFFIVFFMSLQTRKIIHYNITFNPDHPWMVQQLKEAFPYPGNKCYLIHDNDSKLTHLPYQNLGITPVPTSFNAPNMNAFMERFIRSARSECLDHFIFFSEIQLRHALKEYVNYYNSKRPHQGIDQMIPENKASPGSCVYSGAGTVRKEAILNGLRHHYYREAA